MTPTTVLDSRRSWLRLGVTMLVGIFVNAGMWTIIVIMPQMERAFGLTRADASLIFVITMLGFALGNVVTGRMVDRAGVVPTLLGAAALVGTGHLAAAFAPTVWLVALAQFVVGLGSAGGLAPLMADISHWFLKRRGIAMSVAASANYMAGVTWPLLLNVWIAAWGWQWAYAMVGAVLIVVVPPLAWALRARAPAEARAASDRAAASRAMNAGMSANTLTLLLLVAGIACCVAMAMPQVHIVAYCMDLGYGPAVGAEMLSLMLMGGVVSRLAGGVISDRIGGVATLLLFGSMQMVALFLYIPFDGLVPLYVVSLIFGLSQGGLLPSYALIVREYMPASVAGARVGLIMMATILGMAIGGWMSGWIHDVTQSYALAFINGILWNGLNVGIAIWIMWRAGRLRIPPQAGKAAASA
ncbi:Sugar phosphate permease [Gemmobacter megaterium]|uniref:Sugar phosphate permease n=1 Tax=Gemmobacter megaterium TaxID=1086013 RepID=A0A1N7KWM2_9RHOB|nr:MFS transporter [Gemmobacter megaterium]GGE04251.1 MFS transporter [Gemmobacter megaterium]SIS66009.1 Sugar phosphate permease [Gemmobacter megaterium]